MQIYGGLRTTLSVIQLFQRQISSLAWNSPSSLGLLAEGLGIYLCLHPKSECANLSHCTNPSVPVPQVRGCKPEPVHKAICTCTPSLSMQTWDTTQTYLCLNPKSECANLSQCTSPSVSSPQVADHKSEPVHMFICACTPSRGAQTWASTRVHLCLHPKSDCANLSHCTSPSVFAPQVQVCKWASAQAICIFTPSPSVQTEPVHKSSVSAPQVWVCKPDPLHKPICVFTSSPSMQTWASAQAHLCLYPKSECANETV